jgi:hypothetical protein
MEEQDRPARVVMLTMTDGEENSSKEHTRDQLVEMKDRQENVYNWHFVFIGADIDAFGAAHGMNIKTANAMKIGANAGGVKAAFACMSAGMSRLRSDTSVPCSTKYKYFVSKEQQKGQDTVKGSGKGEA